MQSFIQALDAPRKQSSEELSIDTSLAGATRDHGDGSSESIVVLARQLDEGRHLDWRGRERNFTGCSYSSIIVSGSPYKSQI